jgi:hypothetical protein
VRLAALLLLAGCAAHTPPPPPPPPAVPAELRAPCAVTPAAVPVPPKPRGFDAVVKWGNASNDARDVTAHRLDECRDRHERLVQWTQEHVR